MTVRRLLRLVSVVMHPPTSGTLQPLGASPGDRGKARKRPHIALEYEEQTGTNFTYPNQVPYLPPISTSSMMYNPASNTVLPTTVKIKQEPPDVSTDSPCRYSGRQTHERETVIKHSHPPSLAPVKSELTEQPCCSATSYRSAGHSTPSRSTPGELPPSHHPLHVLPGTLHSDPSSSYMYMHSHLLPGFMRADGGVPPVINGLSFHGAPPTTEAEHTRRVSSEPPLMSGLNPDSPLSFSPWGLAGGPGLTFGTLAGADMSSSMEGRGPESMGLFPPDEEEEDAKGVSPKRRKSLKGRKRVKKEEEEDDGWEPPLWRQQLENIKKMREKRDAPVDMMGAHALAEQVTVVTPEVRRYQVLVSLMLSSQTKDQITAIAMTKLKKHGLTIQNILETPEEDVAKLIHPVGFWRKKAGYIKKVSQILLDKYACDIPTTMEGLVSLPGVGPKMALLVMDIAWDSTDGIAVDTHVHRISHRLGWMRKATENPEVTRASLQRWLPQSEWRELNWLMVGFGQQTCLPMAPKCTSCLNKDICPASKLKGGGPWGKKNKGIKKEKTI